MYQAVFINPIEQFGRVEWELWLSDDAFVYPDIRIPCSFSVGTTQATLDAYANNQITIATASVQTSDPSIPVEVQPGEVVS